jgi:hypothetical protein
VGPDLNAKFDTCIVQQVTAWEVVGTVHDDVVALNDFHDVAGVQTRVVRNHFYVGVQQVERLFCRINFAITNAVDVVQNLALQV